MLNLYDRAGVIPGRSCTRSKSPDRLLRAWADDARFISTVTDTDGIARIDMVCALGARSLGYETTPRMALGVSSLPHRLEVQAAEMALRHVAPWATSIRFTKTGSESTQAAYIIASAATGRGLALRGSWSYHGWFSWIDNADTFELGADLESKYKDRADLICAVFFEPPRFQGLDIAWLKSIRAFCDKHGILLVYDSMIVGARWALGGTSEYWSVRCDLECFGKGYGNGQAVSFLVGNEPLAKFGEKISGTYSGDATGLSALCDTLSVYTNEPVIETLWELGRQLQAGLRAIVPPDVGVVEGAPVHQRIRFIEPTSQIGGPYDYRTTDRPRAFQFRDAMAARGVLWHPDCVNVCYAHADVQIDAVIQAASESLAALQDSARMTA